MYEVDLAELEQAVRYLRAINSLPFNEIKWLSGGEEILPTTKELQRIREDWDCIGLANTDYGKMLLGLL